MKTVTSAGSSDPQGVCVRLNELPTAGRALLLFDLRPPRMLRNLRRNGKRPWAGNGPSCGGASFEPHAAAMGTGEPQPPSWPRSAGLCLAA